MVYGSFAKAKSLKGQVLQGPTGSNGQPIDVVIDDAAMTPEFASPWVYEICCVLQLNSVIARSPIAPQS